MLVTTFDLETFLIERLRPAPTPVCIAQRRRWRSGNVDAASISKDVKELVDIALLDSDVIVGHNVAYDFGVSMAAYPELTRDIFDAYKDGRVTDTDIRQQLCDVALGRARDDDAVRRYSLAYLVQTCFDTDISELKSGPDAWRLRYGELYDVPLKDWPQAAIDYPLSDAEWTDRVWYEQETKGKHLIRGDAFLTYAAYCLHLMSCFGLRTDADAVRELEERTRANLAELLPPLLDSGLVKHEGPKCDPKRKLVKKQKAAQQYMLYVCRTKGIEPLLTKTGREVAKKAGRSAVDGQLKYISLDKAACIWADDKLLLKRAEYILQEKILSTYIPALWEGTKAPITTSYGLAATMRTTSSAPRDPAKGTNLQNMPRKGGIRECYVPRRGYLYMAGDFSGAELCCLAQVCKDKLGYSVLGDVLNSGNDVHCFFAAQLMGVDYDEAYARYKAGDEIAKEARQDAKNCNFGFGGSMGPAGFVALQLKQGRRYTLERAEYLRNMWLQAFPEMPEYFEWCKLTLGPNKDATVELWKDGPLRRVRKLTTLANTGFQALAAKGGKQAVCDVTEACYAVEQSLLYGTTRPAVFVHDEILCETRDAPREALHNRAVEFAGLMEDAFNSCVPDYPTRVDPVLMRRWYKEAETVRDEDGFIIPWEPAT